MGTWKKTFICAFIAQICSITGFSFALPFMPFFIGDLGVTDAAERALWAGVAMGATGVTLSIFSPVWGMMADKFGRKAMVIRAMFGGTIVMLLMSCAQSVGQLIFCRLLQGVFTGTVAASTALVASVTPPHRSGLTLGMMQTAVFMGVAIGPLIGGVVADHLGFRTAFRIGAAILFLGGLLVLYGTKENFDPAKVSRKEKGANIRKIFLTSGFPVAVLVLFSIRFSNTLAGPSFPLIIEEIVGNSARLNSITGGIVFGAAVSGAVTAGIMGHFGDLWGHKRVMMVCGIIASLASLGHVYVGGLDQLLFARMLFGAGVAAMGPAANAMIMRVTKHENIGTAYGIATGISTTGFAFGPFLGGWIGRHFGLRVPFLVTAIGQAFVVLIVVVCVRGRMRNTAP